MTSIIDVSVYSAQMSSPKILYNIKSLEEAVAILDGIPDNVLFDFHLDVYDVDDPTNQEVYSALGKTSTEEVKMFIECIWHMIGE